MTRALRFTRRYLTAAARAAWLFLIGWTREGDRQILDMLADGAPRATAPRISSSEIIDREAIVELRELVAVNGNVSLQELAVLASLVRLCGPRRIFEFGTFDGRSTVNMAVNARARAKVLTLDLPSDLASATALRLDADDLQYIVKEGSGARYRDSDVSDRVVQLYGDSATFDFAPYRGTVDMVFIDGSHSYDYVLSDSRNALELLRDGRGLVVWHDYGEWPGVTRALNDLRRNDPSFANLKRITETSLGYLDLA